MSHRLDGFIPNTPMPLARNLVNGTSMKRKAGFDNISTSKASKSEANGVSTKSKTLGKANEKVEGIQ